MSALTSSNPGDRLRVFRLLLAMSALGLLVLGIVLPLVLADDTESASLSPELAVLVVGALGIAATVLGPLLPITLDPAGPQSLIESYQRRFFARMAIAEAPALIGFALSFVSGAVTPYLAGAFFAFVGFARLWPSDRRLERDQEELTAAGCPHSLADALRGS